MATKQFAIPLDSNSSKPGDTDFEQLVEAGASADFTLTNVTSSPYLNELNLITEKKGVKQDHKYTPSFKSGSAKVALSASELANVYADAEGGDLDYVEAKWTVGQVDTPSTSNLTIFQSGNTYNAFGW